MTAAIEHRGPHGVGHWIQGAVGLGFQALRTTPEALHERQPLYVESGSLSLIFDGRIDNRDELRGALVAGGIEPRQDSDAELALCAYRRWGEDCPQQLVGDFALALWDARKRRLFCARDYLGIRPFYYYLDDRVFVFGSELQQVLEHPSVPRRPNEGMVAEYLSSAITSSTETLYQGVFRLEAAHWLSIEPGQRRLRRYWRVDPGPELRYRDDDEYAQQFRALFAEAVRCRLRSAGPLGADLSGGLDSSAVVGMAASLLRDGALADPGLETISMLFPGQSCDESEYIQHVIDTWEVRSNVVLQSESMVPSVREQVRKFRDFPDYPNSATSYVMKRRARELGIHATLTGIGGDHWFTGSRLYYADFLRQGRLGALARELRNDARKGGRVAAQRLFDYGLTPLVPPFAQRMVRRIDPTRWGPPWIDARFARRIGLSERIYRGQDGERYASFAQWGTYRGAMSGTLVHYEETEERVLAWFGLEQRHPFHDRRLVEFALALPENQRQRGTERKFVLRQGLRGILPEPIRRRQSKAEFSWFFAEQLERQAGAALFDRLEIAAQGWIDAKRAQDMYSRAFALSRAVEGGYTPFLWPLWMIFGIELWFRSEFGGGLERADDIIPTQPTAPRTV